MSQILNFCLFLLSAAFKLQSPIATDSPVLLVWSSIPSSVTLINAESPSFLAIPLDFSFDKNTLSITIPNVPSSPLYFLRIRNELLISDSDMFTINGQIEYGQALISMTLTNPIVAAEDSVLLNFDFGLDVPIFIRLSLRTFKENESFVIAPDVPTMLESLTFSVPDVPVGQDYFLEAVGISVNGTIARGYSERITIKNQISSFSQDEIVWNVPAVCEIESICVVEWNWSFGEKVRVELWYNSAVNVGRAMELGSIVVGNNAEFKWTISGDVVPLKDYSIVVIAKSQIYFSPNFEIDSSFGSQSLQESFIITSPSAGDVGLSSDSLFIDWKEAMEASAKELRLELWKGKDRVVTIEEAIPLNDRNSIFGDSIEWPTPRTLTEGKDYFIYGKLTLLEKGTVFEAKSDVFEIRKKPAEQDALSVFFFPSSYSVWKNGVEQMICFETPELLTVTMELWKNGKKLKEIGNIAANVSSMKWTPVGLEPDNSYQLKAVQKGTNWISDKFAIV